MAAARSGDRAMALRALATHPLVGAEVAERMLDAILDANRSHLPRFFATTLSVTRSGDRPSDLAHDPPRHAPASRPDGRATPRNDDSGDAVARHRHPPGPGDQTDPCPTPPAASPDRRQPTPQASWPLHRRVDRDHRLRCSWPASASSAPGAPSGCYTALAADLARATELTSTSCPRRRSSTTGPARSSWPGSATASARS